MHVLYILLQSIFENLCKFMLEEWLYI